MVRMSLPFRTDGSDTEERLARPAALGPLRRVLVSYESSPHGRAALFHALGVARRAGAPMTVVSVTTNEPVNVGCARCRRSAAIWNRELRSLAQENLAEAAGLVGSSPAVDYAVAVGRPVHAIGQAADRSGADVIVLPWEPSGRLRRLFSSTVAEELGKAGPWEVIVAPAAAPRSVGDSYLVHAVRADSGESDLA